jgi:D-ribose pyranose/furanose isomerase RbsD
MPPFIYWIYFDKVGKPERIYAKTYEEFKDLLDRLIMRTGEMPEWINRSYK